MAKGDQIALIVNPEYSDHNLTRVLEQEFSVEVFSRGIDAYSWMHSGHIPDLVIIDEQLPDMDVKELISRFKNSSYYCDIPFVVLPHFSDENQIDELLKVGAESFVAFPIDEKWWF